MADGLHRVLDLEETTLGGEDGRAAIVAASLHHTNQRMLTTKSILTLIRQNRAGKLSIKRRASKRELMTKSKSSEAQYHRLNS